RRGVQGPPLKAVPVGGRTRTRTRPHALRPCPVHPPAPTLPRPAAAPRAAGEVPVVSPPIAHPDISHPLRTPPRRALCRSRPISSGAASPTCAPARPGPHPRLDPGHAPRRPLIRGRPTYRHPYRGRLRTVPHRRAPRGTLGGVAGGERPPELGPAAPPR